MYQTALNTNHSKHSLTINRSTSVDHIDDAVSRDLWSTAYREAVESLGEDVDISILKGRNVKQRFKELEEIDNDTIQNSVFLRGVKYLRSIQVPLKRFNLAVNLASPLVSLDPTASIVFCIVRGVITVSSIKTHYPLHPAIIV